MESKGKILCIFILVTYDLLVASFLLLWIVYYKNPVQGVYIYSMVDL